MQSAVIYWYLCSTKPVNRLIWNIVYAHSFCEIIFIDKRWFMPSIPGIDSGSKVSLIWIKQIMKVREWRWFKVIIYEWPETEHWNVICTLGNFLFTISNVTLSSGFIQTKEYSHFYFSVIEHHAQIFARLSTPRNYLD